jgi:GAF domain-containing protein
VDELIALGLKTAALIPIFAGEALQALIVIASRQENSLSAQHLQPFYSLAQLARTAIEKILAQQQAERHLSALQSLNTISQAVSVETDLYTLYQAIHQEVKALMGEVDFAIATVDPKTELIHIPYLHAGNELRAVDPFSIGQGFAARLRPEASAERVRPEASAERVRPEASAERSRPEASPQGFSRTGLIAQVIATGQPLLVHQDGEPAGQTDLGGALGAGGEFGGAAARSWLGVPLVISGEVIGAVILQDVEQEGRFDEADQRLLMTLAAQVAVAMRNARLLESVYRQAERERNLYEITNKIRGEVEMQKILEVTARELSLALSARRAHIEISGGSG